MRMLILIVALLLFIPGATAQSNWTCQTMGNMTFCYGYLNGRYTSCTTTYVNGQSFTNCT